MYSNNILYITACQVILRFRYFSCIMAKKKNIKSGMDDVGLNKLSRLMLDQNNSLRKLLEEISRKEKENAKKSVDTNEYQIKND